MPVILERDWIIADYLISNSGHHKVIESEATKMTPIVINEFGEKSFSFVAPDGYFWTLWEREKLRN